MPVDDGGPAFPVPNDANVNGQPGMSLRDWFAGTATERDIRYHSDRDKTTAQARYLHADEMLAERKQGTHR